MQINQTDLQGQGNHDTSSAVTICYAIDHLESIEDASLGFAHGNSVRNLRAFRDMKFNQTNLQRQGYQDASSAITIRYAIDHVESIKDASIGLAHGNSEKPKG